MFHHGLTCLTICTVSNPWIPKPSVHITLVSLFFCIGHNLIQYSRLFLPIEWTFASKVINSADLGSCISASRTLQLTPPHQFILWLILLQIYQQQSHHILILAATIGPIVSVQLYLLIRASQAPNISSNNSRSLCLHLHFILSISYYYHRSMWHRTRTSSLTVLNSFPTFWISLLCLTSLKQWDTVFLWVSQKFNSPRINLGSNTLVLDACFFVISYSATPWLYRLFPRYLTIRLTRYLRYSSMLHQSRFSNTNILCTQVDRSLRFRLFNQCNHYRLIQSLLQNLVCSQIYLNQQILSSKAQEWGNWVIPWETHP